MKGSDIIRLIEQDGWYIVRTKGSHHQFKHPMIKSVVTVAGKMSQDVPKGTANNILKQAGLRIVEMRYAIVIERDTETGSYGAFAPDLPGCGAAAETFDEVVALIREAIEYHIEGLRAEGLPIPEPTTSVDYVETA